MQDAELNELKAEIAAIKEQALLCVELVQLRKEVSELQTLAELAVVRHELEAIGRDARALLASSSTAASTTSSGAALRASNPAEIEAICEEFHGRFLRRSRSRKQLNRQSLPQCSRQARTKTTD